MMNWMNDLMDSQTRGSISGIGRNSVNNLFDSRSGIRGAMGSMTWPSMVDNMFTHKRGLGMMAGGAALIGGAATISRRHMQHGRSSGANGLQGRSSGGMM